MIYDQMLEDARNKSFLPSLCIQAVQVGTLRPEPNP